MTQTTYIGLDLETTGLNPANSDIVEIAMIAFDGQLNEVAYFTSLVYSTRADYRRFNEIDDVVYRMHTESGLWDDIDAHLDTEGADDITPAAVQLRALEWIDSLDLAVGTPIMVGNSITFDRTFLAAKMPALLDRFSHRSLDATSVIEAAALTGADPDQLRADAQGDATKHRALDDLRTAARQIDLAINAIRERSAHIEN